MTESDWPVAILSFFSKTVFFSFCLSFSLLPLLSYFLRLLMMANPYHDDHLARGLKIRMAVYPHCD